jgi:GntR family transcriptional regulator, rspAB operon transcriptional repressor
MEASSQLGDGGQTSLTLHDRLREAILTGELPAGAVMSQVELARQFEVSRTPLREAMRMLQREGLIEGEANRRVRVTPISLADLEELYSLRIVTEALGVRLSVPRLTAEDDAFIDHAIAETNRYSAETDFVMKDRWHRAFHERLVQHAGARVVAFLRDLRDHAGRYRRIYVASHDEAWTVAVIEHDLILEAAHERDAALTAGLMARHLARTALSVIGTIAPEHEPAPIRTALRSVLDAAPSQDVFPGIDR